MARRNGGEAPASNRIVRMHKVDNFLIVANAVFADESISWEARGLMGYLLSKPDHWRVRLHDLIRRGPAGEHKIRRMLNELRRAGYLVTRRFKRPDGTFDWATVIFEQPLAPEEVQPRSSEAKMQGGGAGGLQEVAA